MSRVGLGGGGWSYLRRLVSGLKRILGPEKGDRPQWGHFLDFKWDWAGIPQAEGDYEPEDA